MICPICNKPFELKAVNQIYCSSGPGSCKAKAAKLRLSGSRKVIPIGAEFPCSDCNTPIIKTSPNKNLCKECAKQRKYRYTEKWFTKNGPKSKPKPKPTPVKTSNSITCPWERGDIKPVKYGGML